jgi:hypothetical protein
MFAINENVEFEDQINLFVDDSGVGKTYLFGLLTAYFFERGYVLCSYRLQRYWE